jgi:hypothetical protein
MNFYIHKFLLWFTLSALTACTNISAKPIATESAFPPSGVTATQRVEFENTPFPPDPNRFEITTEIDEEFSQQKVAHVLFRKWLDHFLDERISPEYRIIEYKIDSIAIPANQQCAKQLGAVFTAETVSTIKTFIPLASHTSYEHSSWATGSGNILDDNHITKLFTGAIFQDGNIFSLRVITSVPMC